MVRDKNLKRLSREKRADNPPAIVLQERDRQLITTLHRYRFLTREQIERLFFHTTARANHRLKQLFHTGYLSRVFIPSAVGSFQGVYSLAEGGAKEAAIILGIDKAEIKWQKNNKVKPLFLEHALAISEFRLALEAAARLHSDHQLLLWFSEEECKDTFNIWDPRKQQRLTKTLNPDAYGQYRFDQSFFSFFLETDRGTMSNGRVKDKILRYRQYQESGAYESHYGLQFFRVLIVTLTEKRLKNLKKIAEKIGASNVWFATLTKVKENVLGFTWQKAGSEKLHSLIEG